MRGDRMAIIFWSPYYSYEPVQGVNFVYSDTDRRLSTSILYHSRYLLNGVCTISIIICDQQSKSNKRLLSSYRQIHRFMA